jgi:hypothetical protein
MDAGEQQLKTQLSEQIHIQIINLIVKVTARRTKKRVQIFLEYVKLLVSNSF